MVTALALCLLALAPKPLLKDFIGLNMHTVLFKGEHYRSVASRIRNYHPVEWDLQENPSQPATFPMSRNQVDWHALYGGWQKLGYRTLASLMFESIKKEKWTDPENQARAYGKAFAKSLGGMAEAAEVGNEPVEFDNDQYRAIFKGMARGLREGNPKLKIGPCAIAAGDWDKYSRNLEVLKGLEASYDFLNIHTYAFAEHWPTWRRSHPEDPKIKYLQAIREVAAWRDKNAPGKEIWVTEFGWDATTKPQPKEGDFAKFEPSTDLQQAQYLVRSILVFSAMPVDRAYVYWFDDKDEPTLHAASGITRNGVPKPSFHALAQMQRLLGDSRFSRVIQAESGKPWVYEFLNETTRTWVTWRSDGKDEPQPITLQLPNPYLTAHEMDLSGVKPLKKGQPTVWQGRLSLSVSGSPLYIQMSRSR